MKALLVLAIFVANSASANSLVTVSSSASSSAASAPAALKSKARKPAATTNTITATTTATIPNSNASLFENRVFLTTNIVDLSQGNGNLDAHFLAGESLAFSFNYITSSKQEKVPKISTTEEFKVDRRAYGIGGAYFVRPFSNKTTFMINPTFQFGQRSDLFEVENKNGVRLKVSAIHKPSANFALEAGMKADNLENDFEGQFLVGVGVIL